ncbi:tyrosine-type recombinase/integrase [Novosphingobium percolationis]|uniref:tyrosine-type recombinase/integrase n=1 Tax=Novosphingobium percolationis TaxID=2871811 RepID=UPI001CD5D65F|nr:site-specific integrase [Novosphingobium percolationis]
MFDNSETVEPSSSFNLALPDGHLVTANQAVERVSAVPENRCRLTGHIARRKAPARHTTFWDTDVPGFGLRCRASGTKTWIVKYRERRMMRVRTLGSPQTVKVEAARREARRVLAEALLAGLPTRPVATAADAMTFAAFAPEFLACSARHWKPATLVRNRRAIERDLIPFFGEMRLSEIERTDIARWRDSMASRSGNFNRAVPVLSALMNEAEVFGHRRRGSNPCRGIARYKRKQPQRYLSPAEYRALGAAIKNAEGEMPRAVPIIRLLIYTGARLSEIATLNWEWVKPPRLFLPDSKTGPKVIYLNAPARAVLAKLDTGQGKGLVFPAPRDPAKSFDPTSHWHQLRARAGLADVRLHDLRHSFASMAIRDGISLTLIGRLLGHALPETTERYAHLADDTVLEAAQRVSGAIAAKLGLVA